MVTNPPSRELSDRSPTQGAGQACQSEFKPQIPPQPKPKGNNNVDEFESIKNRAGHSYPPARDPALPSVKLSAPETSQHEQREIYSNSADASKAVAQQQFAVNTNFSEHAKTFHQRECSNCYDYAVGRYQPGADPNSGFSTDIWSRSSDNTQQRQEKKAQYRNEILAQLRLDGLIRIDDYFPAIQKEDRVIALFLSDNSNIAMLDYHFLVKHQDGSWSHKPGNNCPTDLDSLGNPILDPKKATIFGDYFGSRLDYEYADCFVLKESNNAQIKSSLGRSTFPNLTPNHRTARRPPNS